MRHLISSGLLLVTAGNSTAFANEMPISEKCFPIERAQSVTHKFAKMKDSRRDTVDTKLTAYFVNMEARTTPPTLYLKDGDTRQDFTITADGEVTGFAAAVNTARSSAQVCGNAQEDGKLGMGMGTDVSFIDRTGPFTLDVLRDGLDDGKSHYKKSVPGPLAMFVPQMTHVMVTYDPLDTPADIVAVVKGEAVSDVQIEPFGKAYVIALNTLENMGAEALSVRGGTFTLSPVPSIKAMKSLGFGPDEGGDEQEDDG